MPVDAMASANGNCVPPILNEMHRIGAGRGTSGICDRDLAATGRESEPSRPRRARCSRNVESRRRIWLPGFTM